MSTSPESYPFPDAQEVLTLEVESSLAKRASVIDSVLRTLEKHGFQPDEFFERLCLDEMISNAIVHGNSCDATKKVRVRVYCSRDRWGWEVIDEGSGFDWQSLLKKLDSGIDQDQDSGRGIPLVMAAGGLEFLEDGRRVRVVREADKK